MNRALIFDFGGVIMKTVDYAPRLTWDKQLGLAPGTVEKNVHNGDSWKAAQRGLIDIHDYWQDVAQRLKLSAPQLRGLQDDFYSGDQLDRTILNYIEAKRREGVQVALLSNDSVELRPKLERLGIASLFDPLVVSAEIGVMKPDKQAYAAVLAGLNRPADETIFIDDIETNIEAANLLQIHGVHYHSSLDLPAKLELLLKIDADRQ